MFSNHITDDTLLVMMNHLKIHCTLVNEPVLIFLEFRIHMPVKKTGSYPKGLASTEGLNVAALNGDLRTVYSSAEPETPNWMLKLSITRNCQKLLVAVTYFLLLFIYFYWLVKVFCIPNHSLLQMFQISSNMTHIFEIYSGV